MRRLVGLTFAVAAICLAADSDQIARGKYLVEQVAKCQDCHSPRLETGELDKTKWLKGTTLDFAPIHEMKMWHKTSPNITGSGTLLPRWKDEGLAKFLETGLNPRGNKADPPMPAYTLSHDDATAIVAYLKSLQ